jgi:hypothetical protein
MRRGYSPIVLLGMGFSLLRQALMILLIITLSYVTLQNWGPDVGPVTRAINDFLRQVVTG